MFSFIDKLVAKLAGEVDYSQTSEDQYAFIRANIINATNGVGKTILVTSSHMSQETLSKFCSNLAASFRNDGHDDGYNAASDDCLKQSQSGYRFIPADGVQKNAYAVDSARIADSAILVEAKGKSLYPQIERCKAQLADIGCKAIGCVFYED